jgi:hypothetical protein
LSTLICSGQITKEEALKELKLPLYKPEELRQDIEYVLKKFSLTDTEFEAIMKTAPRKHSEFKTDTRLKQNYMRLLQKTQKVRKVFK